MNKILATIAGVALTVLPATAFAASTTGSVNVSANVQAACTLVTATPLAFGNYDPITGITGASTGPNESIQCTNTTTWTLGVPAGTSLTGPGAAVLAASNLATSPASGTGTGAAQSFAVTGDIAAGQYSTPGAYSGSVLVTANF